MQQQVPTRAFHVMAKPSGSDCNLNCDYCFYLEKQSLYHEKPVTHMDDDTLEAYVRHYIAASETQNEVAFTWQGGEPTLLGLDFYRRAVALQAKYGHAQRVPVKTGSVTELVSILGKKVTAEEVNNALKKATNNNESFGYTDEEIVSSDIIGSHFGSVFDATQTEITAVGDLQLVKTVAWYDNEYGFVTQLIRTLEKFAKL